MKIRLRVWYGHAKCIKTQSLEGIATEKMERQQPRKIFLIFYLFGVKTTSLDQICILLQAFGINIHSADTLEPCGGG